MNILKGKLTYIVAGLTVVWAAVGFFMGWLDGTTALEMVLAGLGAFGIRRALPTPTP